MKPHSPSRHVLSSHRRLSVECSALEDPRENTALRAQRHWLRRQRVLKKEPVTPDMDIIELNVGGKVMVTHRSTLLQAEGSRLYELFASGNEVLLARDINGRVFLDYDPYCFGLILRYLRQLKLAEGSSESVPVPEIRKEDEVYFRQLVTHLRLGLEDKNISSAVVECPASSPTSSSSSSSSQQGGHKPKSSELVLRRPTTPAGLAPGLPSAATTKLQTPKSSQLFYIQAHQDKSKTSAPGRQRGIKISVYTESDLKANASKDSFDMFCDATYGAQRLSFSVVARSEFDNMYIGVTSKNQVDQRGLQIPCFGWKRSGWRYSGADAASSSSGSSSKSKSSSAAKVSTSSSGSKSSSRSSKDGSSSTSSSIERGTREVRDPHHALLGAGSAADNGICEPLWKKGDSVELVVDLATPNRLALKVNGQEVDCLTGLPTFRHWCWYVALFTGTDVSCVVFEKTSYAVFWGDYQVKRYLTA
eukprot:jgi/Chrzof1/7572/Cz02g28250.t1